MSARARATIDDFESLLTFKISLLYNRLALGTSRELANGFDLTLREWRVLALVAGRPSMTASELVARSPLDKASVSRAVASLAEKRLVSVGIHAEDARIKELVLTRAGRRLYARIAPRSLARQRALLSVLSASERETLFQVLDKLMARASMLLEGTRP